MFPHSHHPLQLPPVDHSRISKPPLRPIHPNRLPGERRLMPRRPSMNLIPFWHPALSSKTENNGDGITPSPPLRNQLNSQPEKI
jgi:hypothetical protein